MADIQTRAWQVPSRPHTSSGSGLIRSSFLSCEETIHKRTTSNFVEDILGSIRDFQSKLQEPVSAICFHESPFPIFHPDSDSSYIIIDHWHDILLVID